MNVTSHKIFRSIYGRFAEKYFNDWNKILLDKDEKDRMDNFAVISRDDLSRRKVADEMKIAADKQAKYESQLKKMGIPVIVGMVSCCAISLIKRNWNWLLNNN